MQNLLQQLNIPLCCCCVCFWHVKQHGSVLHFHAASLGACSAKQTTPTTTHTPSWPAAHAQPRQSVPWRRHARTALGECVPAQLSAHLILSFCIHAREREGGGDSAEEGDGGQGGDEWMSAWFKRHSCGLGVDIQSQHLPPKQVCFKKKQGRETGVFFDEQE